MDLYPVSIDREGELGPIDVSLRNDGPGEWYENRVMYMVAIVDGTAYLFSNDNVGAEHVDPQWHTVSTIGPADDVAVEFNGYWQREPNGRYRFYSEGEPWLFWVTSAGALNTQHGAGGAVTALAASGVTKISAIRGWKPVRQSYNDQGLIIAYIKSGTIHYRAYVEQNTTPPISVWEDERQPLDGSSNPFSAVDIGVARTNDYRTVFLYETAGGEIHWLVTHRRWAGMALPAEHLDVSITNYSIRNILPDHGYEAETLAVSINEYDLYLLWAMEILLTHAENREATDPISGDPNWGLEIYVTFDYKVDNVIGNESAFIVTDEASTVYTVSSTEVGDNDYQVKLNMVNLNGAFGQDVTVQYDGTGSLTGLDGKLGGTGGQAVGVTSITFTPTNLIPSAPPEWEAMWNE